MAIRENLERDFGLSHWSTLCECYFACISHLEPRNSYHDCAAPSSSGAWTKTDNLARTKRSFSRASIVFLVRLWWYQPSQWLYLQGNSYCRSVRMKAVRRENRQSRRGSADFLGSSWTTVLRCRHLTQTIKRTKNEYSPLRENDFRQVDL